MQLTTLVFSLTSWSVGYAWVVGFLDEHSGKMNQLSHVRRRPVQAGDGTFALTQDAWIVTTPATLGMASTWIQPSRCPFSAPR